MKQRHLNRCTSCTAWRDEPVQKTTPTGARRAPFPESRRGSGRLTAAAAHRNHERATRFGHGSPGFSRLGRGARERDHVRAKPPGCRRAHAVRFSIRGGRAPPDSLASRHGLARLLARPIASQRVLPTFKCLAFSWMMATHTSRDRQHGTPRPEACTDRPAHPAR